MFAWNGGLEVGEPHYYSIQGPTFLFEMANFQGGANHVHASWRDLKKDFGTKAALWGYVAHPLIDGNKLLCVVGGEGSHVVAFDKKTGKEIWKTLN